MLTSANALRDKLVALDNDIRLLPGRRVALLGFADANAKRVDDNLRTLIASSGWTVIDARSSSPGPLRERLAQALTAQKLALFVDVKASLPADAGLLIRSLYDSHDAVRWASGEQSELPGQRILYVIASGARSVDDLPPLLAKLDFMVFIKSPK